MEKARREEAKRRKAALAALERKRQQAMAIAREEKAKKREMERQLEEEKATASEKAQEDAKRVMAKPAVAAYLSAKVPKILAGKIVLPVSTFPDSWNARKTLRTGSSRRTGKPSTSTKRKPCSSRNRISWIHILHMPRRKYKRNGPCAYSSLWQRSLPASLPR